MTVVSWALGQRNAQIRAEIIEMMRYKSNRGRQKYTSGYIFDFIAAKHDLEPRTVQNIFWETGSYCMPVSPPQNAGIQP